MKPSQEGVTGPRSPWDPARKEPPAPEALALPPSAGLPRVLCQQDFPVCPPPPPASSARRHAQVLGLLRFALALHTLQQKRQHLRSLFTRSGLWLPYPDRTSKVETGSQVQSLLCTHLNVFCFVPRMCTHLQLRKKKMFYLPPPTSVPFCAPALGLDLWRFLSVLPFKLAVS